MTEYFTIKEFHEIKKERRKVLLIYAILLAIYLAISGGFVAWYLVQPYLSDKIWLIKLLHYTVTLIFAIFSTIYFGIKYRLVNAYYKRCYEMSIARSEKYEGNFIEYSYEKENKDNVEIKSLIFLEWNKYKEECFERKVYVPFNKPFPEIKENQMVTYTTQGNFLIAYEIQEKGE